MDLSVVIPVYNEAEILAETVAEVRRQCQLTGKSFEIILVNDASTDGSGEIADGIADVRVIHHRCNHGYGTALKRGFRASTGGRLLIIDADGTYPIDRIPEMVTLANDYHMVIGQRETTHEDPLKTFAKWILKIFAFFLTGTWIPDLNSGLRVFDRELAERFEPLFPARFSLTTTITLAALTCQYDVLFHPIPYYKRVGQSSIKPWAFVQFATLLFRIIMYFNPLRFFLVPGCLLLLGGIVHGTLQVVDTGGIGEMPVILVMTGIQACFLGFLADLVVKSRLR